MTQLIIFLIVLGVSSVVLLFLLLERREKKRIKNELERQEGIAKDLRNQNNSKVFKFRSDVHAFSKIETDLRNAGIGVESISKLYWEAEKMLDEVEQLRENRKERESPAEYIQDLLSESAGIDAAIDASVVVQMHGLTALYGSMLKIKSFIDKFDQSIAMRKRRIKDAENLLSTMRVYHPDAADDLHLDVKRLLNYLTTSNGHLMNCKKFNMQPDHHKMVESEYEASLSYLQAVDTEINRVFERKVKIDDAVYFVNNNLNRVNNLLKDAKSAIRKSDVRSYTKTLYDHAEKEGNKVLVSDMTTNPIKAQAQLERCITNIKNVINMAKKDVEDAEEEERDAKRRRDNDDDNMMAAISAMNISAG